jgi:hypothetical protein
MNKRRVLILAAALLGGLALVLSADESSVVGRLATGALAQGSEPVVDWWVVAGGGGESSGAGAVAVNSTLGQPIIGPSSDSVSLGAGYWYGAEGPTAVTLASFTATPVDGNILVEWETAMEIDTVGFDLYRAQSPGGPYAKLNASLIPSQSPGSVFGATYAWLDEDVQGGITYYYKLEDVEIGGQRTFHGPIAAQAGGPTAVRLRTLNTHGLRSMMLLAALIATGGLAAAWWIRKWSARTG